MHTQSTRSYVHIGLCLLAALALGIVGGLSVWASGHNTTASPAVETPVATLPPVGTISGTIYYDGVITGTHDIYVNASPVGQHRPEAWVVLHGPGPYTITLETPGEYNIGAIMNSTGGDPEFMDPRVDPTGEYPDNPILVTAGSVITGVDIILVDPVPPPTGEGSISGEISYVGQITETYDIVIGALLEDLEQGHFYYNTIIEGVGPYTIEGLPDGTYQVFAFMDLVGHGGPPEPNFPFAWYDPESTGQAAWLVIEEGEALTGIDILLLDPDGEDLLYMFLPLVANES
jgi:hypothetical protein